MQITKFTFHLTQNLLNTDDFSIVTKLLNQIFINRENNPNLQIQILCSEEAVYMILFPELFLSKLKDQPNTEIFFNLEHCKSLLNEKNTQDLIYQNKSFQWIKRELFNKEIILAIQNPSVCYLKF
ncbi:hypothetical protein [Candidatus Harpocratesius sp.]